ncbi:helicase C-terminal domain-containing protein [Clostridioides difficile]|uniref:helicase C-terminal domain-containing protein n=2 Tax=Clostridioides difficile TaxID=1496 RepID=UPI0009800A47|nr:helicase C-terminal domain-containing protein [Clostridioides difficile]UUV13780.1 exonuclease domain-containing protein [Clostridioides difficile]SJP00287.1 Probable ATP-dependent helicase dinG homolog [Clostridioides difficile]HBF4255448.1 exonuclease [Clostridioides difficile]
MDNIISVLNDVVFLDIEVTGLDCLNSEILEVGAVKVKDWKVYTYESLIKNKFEVPIEVFSVCRNLDKNDLEIANEIEMVEDRLVNFVEDNFIICHDLSLKKKFFEYHMPKLKNKFIDLIELAVILEPYHKDYSLEYLKNTLTNCNSKVENRALSDAIDIINIVNCLLVKFNNYEKTTLEPLSFKINSYLKKFNLPTWEWSRFLEEANYDLSNNININKEYNIFDSKEEKKKERETLKILNEEEKNYEELLKYKTIWENKEGFTYEYRPGQYELTKTIRELFRNSEDEEKIACIEAPTGIGKSVGYLLPAILEARINKKRLLISTDTKELQIQLINKDIPNVLDSLGLNGKVSYGYIKGKNNYICIDRLEAYIDDYESQNPTKGEILSLIFLKRLVEGGKYGDIEEINYSVFDNFKEISTHLRNVSCDPNMCRPKKCKKDCLYKNRIEELKEEHITVVNHSLLAKWPYKDEKPLENIIVDEAHNLTEKGYDFFSSIINSKSLRYLLQEIYPYEFIQNSSFIYKKYSRNMRKIKAFDKFYNVLKIEREDKQKIARSINLIIEEIDSILNFGNCNEYNNVSNYNLRWELNLQIDEIVGKLKKDGVDTEISYRAYSEKIKLSCEKIIKNLVSIIIIIYRNIDDDSIDKEADIYKFGKAKTRDLEDIKIIFEIFLEYDEKDDYARIVEIDKNYNDFEFRVVPLKIADLFEENILSQLEKGIFLSATLSLSESMSYFKNTLGIDRVKNVEKIIEPIFDYKNRVSVVGFSDICEYRNSEFPNEMSKIISNISKITEGHTLALFNSKDRQEKTYEILKKYLHSFNLEIYADKKGIRHLNDLNRKCVVLGSKGCFEGVDIPGDGLVCVTLDKLPNLNPKDPLYFTIMKKYSIDYYTINYPQMTIKVKQAMGRILRSKYDYGCFVIFDVGTNLSVLKRLEKDLHNCKISKVNSNEFYTYIRRHLNKSRSLILKSVIFDTIKALNVDAKMDNNDVDKDIIKKDINENIRQRAVKGEVYHIDIIKKDMKVKYFDRNYLINLDIFMREEDKN